MLNSITWSQYCFAIGLATALYYLFIWIVFHKVRFSFLNDLGRFNTPGSLSEDAPDEVMSTIQHVLDELRPVFAGRRNRSELLMSLQGQLIKYKNLDDPVFRETVNQFISAESDRQCSIRLSEDDLRVVWL